MIIDRFFGADPWMQMWRLRQAAAWHRQAQLREVSQEIDLESNSMSADTYCLRAWHKVVSIKDDFIQISVEDGRFSYRRRARSGDIHGFYAKYREGVFVLYKDKGGRLSIGWKKNVLALDTVDRICWESTLRGLMFECFDQDNHSLMQVRYRWFHQYLINPLKLIWDLVVPDDEWDLVSDLPSWVDSWFDDGSLGHRFDDVLLQRELSGER
ncbi:hypothetical protein [Pyruvatibacter sp.]|uniref:hypothetical protein n=1 Tax=Pyruvatibacter sp. TaxID=1981328 RepID=UPI003263ADEF